MNITSTLCLELSIISISMSCALYKCYREGFGPLDLSHTMLHFDQPCSAQGIIPKGKPCLLCNTFSNMFLKEMALHGNIPKRLPACHTLDLHVYSFKEWNILPNRLHILGCDITSKRPLAELASTVQRECFSDLCVFCKTLAKCLKTLGIKS